MTVTTTIQYMRNNEIITSETRSFRGRWIGNIERKAMQYAEMDRLFLYSDRINILCELPHGGVTNCMWILTHPVRPLEELGGKCLETA
jgi:hypothetical protein